MCVCGQYTRLLLLLLLRLQPDCILHRRVSVSWWVGFASRRRFLATVGTGSECRVQSPYPVTRGSETLLDACAFISYQDRLSLLIFVQLDCLGGNFAGQGARRRLVLMLLREAMAKACAWAKAGQASAKTRCGARARCSLPPHRNAQAAAAVAAAAAAALCLETCSSFSRPPRPWSG